MSGPKAMTPKQAESYAEFSAQWVERVEELDPAHWPEMNEMPEADVSDLVRLGQYQSTIGAQFEES